MITFRDLKADEIECRISTVKNNGLSLLLYKDARVDQNILDETVGAENWERDHKELKGNIYCGISIWDDSKKMWVTKWDAGAESYTEKKEPILWKKKFWTKGRPLTKRRSCKKCRNV